MRLLSSDSANIVHLSITSSRYLIVFWLLACAEVLSSTAIAQDDEYRATGQCIIPEVSFWSLPMTDNGAVPVSVEFFLLDLVEISDKDGQFFPSFVISFSWQDSRLKSVAGAGSDDVCSTRLSAIWHPHYIFVNTAESANNYDGLVDVHSDGRVTYSIPVTRRFTIDLDLRKFPFDKQLLTVELASLLYGPGEVAFIVNEAGTGILDGAAIQGWRVGQIIKLTDQPIVTANSSHATIDFAIPVRRHSSFYFWRLIFPLLLITLMSWSVFWLEPSQLGSQIAVATGAVFSLMAFLVSLGEILPTVTYLSIADKIVVASMILVFIAFGESIVTGTLVQRDRLELANSIDRVGRWLYLLLVITIFAFTLL